jgi:hypothetical protein
VRFIGCLLLLAGWHLPAAAQTAGAAQRPLRRVEVTVGAGLMGGTPLGRVNATLRPATGQPFRLFSTETEIAAAPVLELRAGTALTRRFEVELRAGFLRPELRTSVTADAEDAPPLTVVERLDQYVVEGSVLVLFDELRLGRAVPFASAGGGYLRQLHEGRTVVEEGHLYHIGGGVKHWLFTRRRGALRAAGLRADGRVQVLVGGFALDDDPRRHLAVSGGFFMVF